MIVEELTETRHEVQVADSTVCYLSVGKGPTVLLAHSYLWDAEMWRPQIDALANHFTLIVPELWGHGGSGPMPASCNTLKDLALVHLGLLDQLGIQKCSLVGLSVGGMWAAELAFAAPERVDSLVLADTYLGAEPEDRQQMYFALLAEVERSAKVSPIILDQIMPLFFSPQILLRNPALVDRFRASLRGWPEQRIRDSVIPLGRMIFGRRDALADLGKLRAPSLIISGRDDRSRPPCEGRQMADILSSPMVEIPDAGHISCLEQPEIFTDVLLKFLLNANERAG